MKAEQKRLSNASKLITQSIVDYSPLARALQELAILVFLELVEEAAKYREAFKRWNDADTTGIIDSKKGATATPKRKP